jgi:leucyl-tRNA---protein transferase
MTEAKKLAPFTIQFYPSEPYPCNYLEGQEARSQVARPSNWVDAKVYSRLVVKGFRRSGLHTYRPNCDNCKACVPLRIPTATFTPSRSQRRALLAHGHLQTRIVRLGFEAEHYELYQRYQTSRHVGGGMDADTEEHYSQFLLKTHVKSHIVEFREPAEDGLGELKMVSLVDVLKDGFSAVYTFFDPSPGNSLGTYNVLWQVSHARSLNFPYVYLGYWIKQPSKMTYKSNFKPHELLIDGKWRVVSQ